VRSEAQQRHDAALAVVVGPHDEQHVLRRDHDHQRPKHQGKQAKHNLGGVATAGSKALAQRVDRARADVAVDDTERTDDEGAANRIICRGIAHSRVAHSGRPAVSIDLQQTIVKGSRVAAIICCARSTCDPRVP
jgi:hypothetical protein